MRANADALISHNRMTDGCDQRSYRAPVAVTGACEVAESESPVLGVAVPYAVANVLLTMLGPIIVGTLSAA